MYIISASGSRPLALAFPALVVFFCLKGLYRSSTLCRISAFSISAFSSSVSLPCSSILRRTSCLRSSSPLRYLSLSSMARSCSSFSPPVTSFRYLAIKGTVLPSSISLTACSICTFLTPNSSVSFTIISI